MVHSVEVPVAVAELIDKITILEIKIERFHDAAKLANAKTELTLLYERRAASLDPDTALPGIEAKLKAVNERIWDLEDAIRACERRQDFGPDFVTAARSIYRANDERAALKREINVTTGSQLIEEKSYTAY
jgi:hypothetical protein